MNPTASEKSPSASDLVARLGLEPHPEGGWYREVHRSKFVLHTERGPRAVLTSIYYLLEARQYSRWHVVTSDEAWHYACGAPLELLSYESRSGALRRRVLGAPQDGQEPTGVVAAGEWQAARSLGAWTLVACDVGPGFDFEDFSFVASVAGHEAAFAGTLAPYSGLL
jgi:predicted cupin superfamily sugar epimerase